MSHPPRPPPLAHGYYPPPLQHPFYPAPDPRYFQHPYPPTHPYQYPQWAPPPQYHYPPTRHHDPYPSSFLQQSSEARPYAPSYSRGRGRGRGRGGPSRPFNPRRHFEEEDGELKSDKKQIKFNEDADIPAHILLK